MLNVNETLKQGKTHHVGHTISGVPSESTSISVLCTLTTMSSTSLVVRLLTFHTHTAARRTMWLLEACG